MASLRVKVQRMAAEGQAIAKAAGSDRVLFVPYGVPGDELDVDVVEEKKTFALARIRVLVSPGPTRRDPPCAYHFTPAKYGSGGAPALDAQGPAAPERGADVLGDAALSPPGTAGPWGRTSPLAPARWCGGCDWQHFHYESQLTVKRDMVLDCLRRIGKFQDVLVLPAVGSPQEWRYRNKVQVPFSDGPSGLVAGFYHPGSHEIVDFDDCLVQPELSVAIVRKVKELAITLGWKPYNSREHSGWLRHLFVRTNSEGEALAAFVTRTGEFPHEERAVAELTAAFPKLRSLFQNVQSEKTSVILGPVWRKLWGQDGLVETLGPLKLSASPGAFLQVNTGATERLYSTAEAMLFADGLQVDTVLDLYSGVGAIALWVAKRARRVVGVEEAPAAVQDAIENVKRNAVRNVRFMRSTAEAFFRTGMARSLGRPMAAVLDPPRAGCEPHVLRRLAGFDPVRIVYVSCNPATFARDARVLADSGFVLRRVQPVDLFPQTSHVELVGVFDAGGPRVSREPAERREGRPLGRPPWRRRSGPPRSRTPRPRG